VTGSTAVARIEEAFYMDWLQRPEPLSTAAAALRQRNPE